MADRLDRRRLPWQGSFGSDNRRSVDFPPIAVSSASPTALGEARRGVPSPTPRGSRRPWTSRPSGPRLVLAIVRSGSVRVALRRGATIASMKRVQVHCERRQQHQGHRAVEPHGDGPRRLSPDRPPDPPRRDPRDGRNANARLRWILTIRVDPMVAGLFLHPKHRRGRRRWTGTESGGNECVK